MSPPFLAVGVYGSQHQLSLIARAAGFDEQNLNYQQILMKGRAVALESTESQMSGHHFQSLIELVSGPLPTARRRQMTADPLFATTHDKQLAPSFQQS
jgi:hypothetical protein